MSSTHAALLGGATCAAALALLLFRRSRTAAGEDERLKGRAKQVLASLTHLSTELYPPGYSQFFERGRGCRVTDVDGKEYIDFMCSFGPILLGHCHPAVERAVREQQRRGTCLIGPTARMVELAELYVETVPWAAWALFMKNGTDATTAAVRIARAQTGRRVILRSPHSYHGSTGLWKEEAAFEGGVLPEEHAGMLPYTFNDVASVRAAADLAGDDFAGIICAAFKWDFAEPQELPTAAFLRALRQLCDERGAVLICDDVRSSLRLDLRGSWAPYGVAPDLACMCKGIANGHPLACVLGCEAVREGSRRMSMLTGSFWCNADAFAAALATLRTMRRTDGVGAMRALGTALCRGLTEQAAALGLALRASGPPQMPYFHFEEEADKPMLERAMILTFCAECARQGVWLHPFHTMFLSTAHTRRDIEATLRVTARALAAVAAMRSGEG